MLTGRLVTDDAPPKAAPQRVAPRTDSSRALAGLLSLARKAEAAEAKAAEADRSGDRGPDPLAGIVARPVLKTLLAALQYRNPPAVLHGRRTARLAVAVASQLGWERPQLTVLELAALLHDLGKIGVPDNILAKPGRLSADEAALLAVHHHIALDVLAAGRVSPEVTAMIADAFPQYGSSAAPQRAADMPLAARILAVADCYDSLRSEQAYRAGLPHDEAMKTLAGESDPRIDATLVQTLGRLAASVGPHAALFGPHLADAELPGLGPADSQEAASVCGIFAYMYILESLYDGFSLVDGDLKYVLVSRGAARLKRRPAAEFAGRIWTCRFAPLADADGRPLPDHEHPFPRVLAEGRSVTLAAAILAGDRLAAVEVQAVPLADDAGRMLGIAEIYRDQSRTNRNDQQIRELKLAATRDPLTGLSNRGELETCLTQALRTSSRAGGTPFSALFLDVDFFKRINDHYGHAVGDEVLVGLAKLLRQECYSGETIGRYGGEEFVVVCPETDLDAARRRAERLRLAVSQSILCGDPDLRVTASFGVASVEKKDSVESLLKRADAALYQAKRTGRNRTCSLGSAELAARDAVRDAAEEPEDPFVYKATFRACLTSDMATLKLGGFLREENANLRDVSPGNATLRLGRGGLFGGWGKTADRRPVDLRIEFGDAREATGTAAILPVRVTVLPVGRCGDVGTFRERAGEAVNLLRSYLAGSD